MRGEYYQCQSIIQPFSWPLFADRPALFYTYLSKRSAEDEAYLNGYGYLARRDQQINTDRAVELSKQEEEFADFMTR